MRRFRWSARHKASCGLVAAAVVVGLAAGAPGASADPKHEPVRVSGSDLLGDGHGPRDKDNRIGTAAPGAQPM